MLHRAASSLHAAAIHPGVGVAASASASASRAPRVAAAAAARRPTNPTWAADDACRFFRRPRRPRHDRHHRTYHSRWAVSTYGKDPTVPDSDYDGYDDELEEYERDGDPHTKNIDRAGKGYVVEEREHGGAVGQLSDAERDLILEGIPNMYDPSEYPDEEEEEEEEEEDDDAVAGDVVAAARRAAAAFASRKDDPGSPSPSQPSQPADDPALAPGLYLVGTPIGNLEDITLRALRVLRTADVVLAEDTRHTRRLLRAYDVDAAALTSYHAHNERSRRDGVMDRLRRGGAVALVSDAGTPAVADPGGDLAAACAAEVIRVVPIPGPCAPAAAVIAAGLGASCPPFAPLGPNRNRPSRYDSPSAHQSQSRAARFADVAFPRPIETTQGRRGSRSPVFSRPSRARDGNSWRSFAAPRSGRRCFSCRRISSSRRSRTRSRCWGKAGGARSVAR